MGAAVILVVARAPALHDQSLTALVEYLSDAGHEPFTINASEEADAYIAGG